MLMHHNLTLMLQIISSETSDHLERANKMSICGHQQKLPQKILSPSTVAVKKKLLLGLNESDAGLLHGNVRFQPCEKCSQPFGTNRKGHVINLTPTISLYVCESDKATQS